MVCTLSDIEFHLRHYNLHIDNRVAHFHFSPGTLLFLLQFMNTVSSF